MNTHIFKSTLGGLDKNARNTKMLACISQKKGQAVGFTPCMNHGKGAALVPVPGNTAITSRVQYMLIHNNSAVPCCKTHHHE